MARGPDLALELTGKRGYTSGMSRRSLLLAILPLLAAPVRAQVKAGSCAPLEGVGCWFAPPGMPSDAPLLVYLRGHHPTMGPNVPPSQFLASARQAFESYGLDKLAVQRKTAILVTYRSGLGVSPSTLEALKDESKHSFGAVSVAAHSGGYVGLLKTFEAGLSPSQVVMLDNFYGQGGGGLAGRLQRLVSSGARCTGFYTPHNKANYEAGYKRTVNCAVDAMGSDSMHNAGVNKCLNGYLDGRPCQ